MTDRLLDAAENLAAAIHKGHDPSAALAAVDDEVRRLRAAQALTKLHAEQKRLTDRLADAERRARELETIAGGTRRKRRTKQDGAPE